MSLVARLHLFGPLRIEHAEGTLARFPTRRSALILARAATARDRRMGRDELAEELWPDEYLDVTRVRLRQELRRLRESLGAFGHIIDADRQWVSLVATDIAVDVWEFDAAMRNASIAEDSERRIQQYDLATKQVTGPFLAGYLEPWTLSVRQSYAERVRQAWLALAEAQEAGSLLDEAIESSLQAVQHDPLDEDSQQALLRRLVARGKHPRARQALQNYEELLQRELGRRPSDELRSILREAPAERAPVSVAVAGEPVLRPPTTFGRESELATALAALENPQAWVNLIGPIGIGKSHFAREIAWHFRQQTGLPVVHGLESNTPQGSLVLRLEELSPEQLGHAAESARRLGHRLLTISRANLGREDLSPIYLGPLPIPGSNQSPAELRTYASVQLLLYGLDASIVDAFTESDWSAIRMIVQKLDGLPLALRLYGSRLRILTPSEILQQWDKGFTEWVLKGGSGAQRESGLEAAWLGIRAELDPELRSAMARLAFLPNGTNRGLADQILGPGAPELLESLARRCLLRVEATTTGRRFRVLEPIRAAIRAAGDASELEAEEAAVLEGIATWAYRLSREQTGPEQAAAYVEMAKEADLLDWAIRRANHVAPLIATKFVVGIWRWGCAQGNAAKLVEPVRVAVRQATETETITFAEAALGLALFLSLLREDSEADEAFSRAEKAFAAIGDVGGVAWVQMNWSARTLAFTNVDRAIELAQSAADTFDRLNQPNGRDLARSGISNLLLKKGEVASAVQLAEQVFAARLRSPDLAEMSRSYADLARIYLGAGRSEAARPLLRQGTQRLREIGLQDFLCGALLAYAEIEPSEFETIVREADEIAERGGNRSLLWETYRVRASQSHRTGDLAGFRAAISKLFTGCAQLSDLFLANSFELFSTYAREANPSLSLAAEAAAAHWRGKESDGPVHPVWSSLWTCDSKDMACAMANAAAEEFVREPAFVTEMSRRLDSVLL